MKKKPKKTFIIFFIGFVIGLGGFVTSFIMYQKKHEPVLAEKKEEDNNKGKDLPSNPVVVHDFLTLKIDNELKIDMVPLLDKFGIEGEAFSFSIENKDNRDIHYVLSLVDNDSTIKNSDVRYQIIKNDKIIGIYTLRNDGIIDIDFIKAKEVKNYKIRMWLNYNSEVKIGKLSKRIGLSEEKKVLDSSNANKPVLIKGMIPVYYDEEKMSFCKSSTENTFYQEWYNYADQKWANAVTVDSAKRNKYIDSPIGTPISMDDINSMWVWIPRFNYNINNDYLALNLLDTKVNTYSAFKFNNQELDGFWVSKFEAGISDDTLCNKISMTNECNNTDNVLYFKPNMTMMQKITLANLFYNIRKMELKDNIYGFASNGNKLNSDGTIGKDNNNFDIHMIKNSEWESIATLSKSQFGNQEIALNPKTVTGNVFFEEKTYPYDIEKGLLGSTTGNIYGVYDMVGGKREYVMANHMNSDIFNKKSNSGFTKKVKSYYYDEGMDELTKFHEKNNSKDYLLNNEPLTRGGYKKMQSNIMGLYGVNDYINKISNETNSRAVISVWKGKE